MAFPIMIEEQDLGPDASHFRLASTHCMTNKCAKHSTLVTMMMVMTMMTMMAMMTVTMMMMMVVMMMMMMMIMRHLYEDSSG